MMGALSVNEPAAPLLSPSLFAPPAPAPVVPQKPAAPSLDLATFKDVLRELVESGKTAKLPTPKKRKKR